MRNVRHGISKNGKDSNAKRTPWDGNKTKKNTDAKRTLRGGK